MTPYYQHAGITIYHGDCREILPQLRGVDLILADPPYPNMTGRVSRYVQTPIDILDIHACQQFVFWHASGVFPLSFGAVHIWDKKTGCQSEYERIFERNSANGQWKVFRHYLINSTVAASFTNDEFTGHPSQKPQRLIRELIRRTIAQNICDPFMGSGTTLSVAKDLSKSAIGIEIEEKYCEIAAKRLSQEVLQFT